MGKPNILWLQGLTCCGNTQSFLSAEDYLIDAFIDSVNILYHPVLTEKELEEIIKSVIEKKVEVHIFILEGAVNVKEKHNILGLSFSEVVKKICHLSDYVIALGNCAAFGNIPAIKDENVVGLQYRFKEKGGLLGKDFTSRKGYPVINISGCPSHPSWFINTVLNIVSGSSILLDKFGRPKEFYAYFSHDGCVRNQYYEWRVEAEEFGKREGCLFYKFGCRGPMTGASCNRILWNGVSSKQRTGQPCFGCTEFDFPREDMWRTEYNMGIPKELPPGVSLRGYIMTTGILKTFAPDRLKKGLFDDNN